MAGNKKSDWFEVSGYAFSTKEDAALAESERKKIEYLRAHMDTRQPETVLALYKKMLSERFFRTPIGNDFLKELHDYLIEQADYPEDAIGAILIYQSYEAPIRENAKQTAARIKPSDKKEKQKISPLFVSVVINIVLVIGVIAMFWIAVNTDVPNILNYEKVLTDKYAVWEQDLTEREQDLRLRELELAREVEEFSRNGN
ncbi:MAG: hypothetical protein IKS07_10580 [Lachnospiraceae bacterium]|nr:hypothetical protein [Lachnospiraceae bacterium]